MPDLTDDELLEQLSANTDCGCITCRMVREIQRRRAARDEMRPRLEALTVMVHGVSVEHHFPGLIDRLDLVADSFRRAEGV